MVGRVESSEACFRTCELCDRQLSVAYRGSVCPMCRDEFVALREEKQQSSSTPPAPVPQQQLDAKQTLTARKIYPVVLVPFVLLLILISIGLTGFLMDHLNPSALSLHYGRQSNGPQFASGDHAYLTCGTRYGVSYEGKDRVLIATSSRTLLRMMELCDAEDYVGLKAMSYPDYTAFPMSPGREVLVIGAYYFTPDQTSSGQTEFYYEVRIGKDNRTYWVHESNLSYQK